MRVKEPSMGLNALEILQMEKLMASGVTTNDCWVSNASIHYPRHLSISLVPLKPSTWGGGRAIFTHIIATKSNYREYVNQIIFLPHI